MDKPKKAQGGAEKLREKGKKAFKWMQQNAQNLPPQVLQWQQLIQVCADCAACFMLGVQRTGVCVLEELELIQF